MSEQETDVALHPSSSERLTDEIIRAVAEAKGVEPTDLETTLHDIVDPDALEMLFRPTATGTPRPRGRVQFRMAGCTVLFDTEVGVTATYTTETDTH